MPALLRARATPAARGRAIQWTIVGTVGCVLGFSTLLIVTLPARLAPLVIMAILCPFAAMVVGDFRKFLLGLILLDTPLQLDINLAYRYDAANLGALGGWNFSVTTACLATLYALWFADALARREPSSQRVLRANRPLVVYIAVALLSTIVARDATLSLFEIFLFLQMFLLYIYVINFVQTREDVLFIITFLLIGLILESLLIIGLGYSGRGGGLAGISSRVDMAKHAGDTSRFSGTLGSANTAGSYLSLSLTIALSVLITSLKRWYKQLALVAFALGAVSLILTFSRGGWTAFAISLTILCFFAWQRGWLSLTVPFAFVVLALLVALVFQDAIINRLVADDRGSAYSRLPLMRLAFQIIRDNPVLGVGANNFAAAIKQYLTPDYNGDFIYSVHNQYLLIWAETGFGGLLAFLWFLAQTLRRAWQCWKLSDRLLSPFALAFMTGLIGYMTHMFVDLFRGRQLMQLIWIIAALIGSIHGILTQASTDSSIPDRA
jgi:putative inorganic carbon (HCO3(-)) transporter